MRKITAIHFAVVLALGVSGCTQKYWVKPGGSEIDFGQDQTACQILAAQAVPVNQQNVAVGTGYKSPVYTSCYGYGNTATCTSTGGSYTPPASYSYDANSSLRDDAVALCLQKKGWTLMTSEQIQDANKRLTSGASSYSSRSSRSSSDGTQKFIVVEGGYCNVNDDCVRGLICKGEKCTPGFPALDKLSKDARFTSYEGQACSKVTTCDEGLMCVNEVCIKK